MKKLTYIICILGLLLCSHVQSQDSSNNQVYIHLENGSKISGEAVSWDHGESITILTGWGEEITFPWRIIKKVVQLNAQEAQIQPYNFKETGLYISPSAALITGNDGNRAKGQNGISVSVSAGHRFNKYLAIGGGLGWDQYIWNSGEELIPFFGEISGYTSERNTSFRYALQAGYSLALSDEDYLISNSKGGWMLYPAVGVRFGNNPNNKYFFDIGYKFQKAEFTYDDAWDIGRRSQQRLLYKRLTIRFGLLL
ncbi:MAG: hypothetical protein HKN09_07030 [Saprospiraceae bacterium]|nr:hypothetical protein [Saprospiraceae bacterium]